MLAGISGTVREVGETYLVIDTGPFCFRVFCARPTLASARPGDEINLHTHLHVREDELSLFGFLTGSEVRLFRLLTSVSGIGPKMALEILATGEGAVRHAIFSENVVFLTSIKGIGKKTAERTVLELREKMESVTPSDEGPGPAAPPQRRTEEEVIVVLEGLGWKRSEIAKKLADAPKELSEAEGLVKWFLTNT